MESNKGISKKDTYNGNIEEEDYIFKDNISQIGIL